MLLSTNPTIQLHIVKMWFLKTSTDNKLPKNEHSKSHEESGKTSLTSYFSECKYKIYYI